VADSVDKSAVVKRSKRYYDGAFLYWWDFSPSWGSALGDYESVEFVKKDSGESCICSAQELTPFLVGRRQTSRGAGNWGVKVLRERPDELAFEPGRGGGEWLFLPVVWLSEDED